MSTVQQNCSTNYPVKRWFQNFPPKLSMVRGVEKSEISISLDILSWNSVELFLKDFFSIFIHQGYIRKCLIFQRSWWTKICLHSMASYTYRKMTDHKKSHTRETLNLSTDADSRTDTIFFMNSNKQDLVIREQVTYTREEKIQMLWCLPRNTGYCLDGADKMVLIFPKREINWVWQQLLQKCFPPT